MKLTITSKDNAQIKYLRKLISSSKFRKEEKKFVIEGLRICDEALKNNLKIKKVFYTEKFYEKNTDLINRISKVVSEVILISEGIAKSISDTENPQGIIAICENIDNSFDNLNLENIQKTVLLENIQNPSNLGSIIRTCDALNIKNIFILGNSCDIYNPKVLRGSMGGFFRVSFIFEENSEKCIKKLQESGFKIYATVPDKNASHIGKINFTGKCGIVFGNEGNGMSKSSIEACSDKITIPMNIDSESLNVSVAAGISMWEMCGRGKEL